MFDKGYIGIVGIGWLVFYAYWLIAAISAKKVVRKGRGIWIWPRLAILLVALITIRLSLARKNVDDHTILTVHSIAIRNVGVVLFLTGLGLAVWARKNLSTNWGMPMSQKARPELIISGPYAAIRHPIYTGILIALFGTALTIGLYLLFIWFAVAAYFIFSATREEQYMLQKFPQKYNEYKKTTKMLLPYIF
ncbi:MAG TPA: isoprenylcysteine carboxylmethyltransferase family protein [Candidatus Saccharimonadales bacterium]|nr:isoprenylcysteine carboxylmethyltransferase family protein [Candidatus Saccharimonadales bacterium]